MLQFTKKELKHLIQELKRKNWTTFCDTLSAIAMDMGTTLKLTQNINLLRTLDLFCVYELAKYKDKYG